MPLSLSGCLVESGSGKSGIETGSHLRIIVRQRYTLRQCRAFRVSRSQVIVALTRTKLTGRVSPLSFLSQWLHYGLWA